MYRLSISETSAIESASFFANPSANFQETIEAQFLLPQFEAPTVSTETSFEAKNAAPKMQWLVYAQAATFVLFTALIIIAALTVTYGVLEILRILEALNRNQAVWGFVSGQL